MNAQPPVSPDVSRLIRRAQRAHKAGDVDKAERLYNAALAHATAQF